MQSRPVKIASWRIPAGSPFLKFTLVVTRGEFGGLIWHPENLWLSDFSWWMLRHACKHMRAHTHTHTRAPVAVCCSSWLLANGLETKNELNGPTGGNIVILFEVLTQVCESVKTQSSMIIYSLKGQMCRIQSGVL